MRESEIAYWDSVAVAVAGKKGIFSDNWMKRRILGQFLLKCEWGNHKVLEIGTGCGATAALLSFSCGAQWDYTGTDLSTKFATVAKGLGLNVVQADVLSLPEGEFTRIIALDSLEHVHPDDRLTGYEAIARRLKKGGLLFINMPCNESLHDDEFDHGIGLVDIYGLEHEGLILQKYDRYSIKYTNGSLEYAFVVMTK